MKTIELEGLKELASLTSSDYSQPENYFINLEVNKILPRKGQPRTNFDSQSQTELEKSISNNGKWLDDSVERILVDLDNRICPKK